MNMVRSGEAAGNLDAVLARLADFLDAQNALRAKVSGALTYPILMMVLGSVVMAILMVVVVPKITSVFEDSGKALPWNTQLLIFVAGRGRQLLVAAHPAAGDRRLLRHPALGAHGPRGARSSTASSCGSGWSARWSATSRWRGSRARWRPCWPRACRC